MPLAGPVAVLVLDRAFRGAGKSALAIASGASLAEAGHALLVGLSLPVLLGQWPSVLVVARGAGAVLLLIVGVGLAAKPTLVSSSEAKHKSGDFVTGLAAAGLNPTLIASWTAVLSALYGEGWISVDSWTAPPFALGVGSGVLAWMCIVVACAHRFRRHMDDRRRRHLVRAFGILLIGLGAYFGIRLISNPQQQRELPLPLAEAVREPGDTRAAPPLREQREAPAHVLLAAGRCARSGRGWPGELPPVRGTTR